MSLLNPTIQKMHIQLGAIYELENMYLSQEIDKETLNKAYNDFFDCWFPRSMDWSVTDKEGIFKCGRCNQETNGIYDYCPHCGARWVGALE